MTAKFDWARRCAGDETQKAAFHRQARVRLKELADAMGLAEGSYDLRSNRGGPAVSGEITLHGEGVYVQASQPVAGSVVTGLLIRSCEGRGDFSGGPNHFASLNALDDPRRLARHVRDICPAPEPDAGPAYRGL
jgi:hypothetical protein